MAEGGVGPVFGEDAFERCYAALAEEVEGVVGAAGVYGFVELRD